VDSTLSRRVYWAAKESGRDMPRFSDDDVIDFLVVEALVHRGREDEKDARLRAKREEWKNNHDDLLKAI
jgi:hypothetical protein